MYKRQYLEHHVRRFIVRPPKGETYAEVQKRMHEFITDVEKTYEGKTILLVSHELPLSLLEGVMDGLSRQEIIEYRRKKAIDTGEWRRLAFRALPLDGDMQLDFHRPHIDTVRFFCPQCKKEKMERVKEVADVWFDSGAMPFAQGHWPFHETRNMKHETQKNVSRFTLHAPREFPADYIVEGIDQTRGWFYTLLAVSTLLGFGTPYRNVISLGHVLDEKGEKMSKSKGNVVGPWDMIKKYGIDAVRWYFYTINHPADPKLFSEKDIEHVLRKFLLTLWNCFIFYETYKTKLRVPKSKFQPRHILDRWIVSRLQGTVEDTTGKLDAYDITGAARAIEQFVVEDLSLWYIRRSRERFQKREHRADYEEASTVLHNVLQTISRILAPFIPFVSEEIFQRTKSTPSRRGGSVHWEDWPFDSVYPERSRGAQGKPRVDKKLEDQMAQVRELVAKGLAERAKVGIKVRQPLALVKFQVSGFKRR